jgi:hypothetical protein
MNNLDRTVGKPIDSEDVDIHVMSSSSGKSGGGMFSMFSNLVGNKALTREDLEPVIASEVAIGLIESVMMKLEGSVMGSGHFSVYFQHSQGCANTVLHEAAHP